MQFDFSNALIQGQTHRPVGDKAGDIVLAHALDHAAGHDLLWRLAASVASAAQTVRQTAT